MKLHLAAPSGLNLISGYGPDHVTVNDRPIRQSLIVTPGQLLQDWAVVRFDDLEALHFEALRALQPEMVLLGTGLRQRFPAPKLYASLLAERIGVEVMDTGAACRTYNILAAEGRQVAAGLIIEA